MDTKGYLELLFNDSANSYYFADMETHEVIYINKVMEKKLRFYDDFTGKKCYKLIHNQDKPCNFCPMSKVKESSFVEQRIFNEVTRNYHRSNSTLLTINDRKICACKYFVAFLDESAMKISYNKAITKCIEILNKKSAVNGIPDFMQLLGQYHQCETTFLYEVDMENKAFACKYSWSREKNHQDVDYNEDKRFNEDFMVWLIASSRREYTFLHSREEHYTTDMVEYKLLEQNKAKNLLLYLLKDRSGKLMGFIGLSNQPKLEFDPRLVQTVSRYVQESYSKNVLLNEMIAVNHLDDQTGFYNRKRYQEQVRDMEEMPPHSLGVLFVSIGDLRRINEQKGFAEGNAMIERSADFLRGIFKAPFYRITGDEFVCFMPDCTEGDFFQQIGVLDDSLLKEGSPVLQIGCAWDTLKVSVQHLVAEADRNTRNS